MARSSVVFVYWLGAVLDGISVGPIYRVDAASFGPEYQFAMFMGASLMAGWTALLVWGAFQPVERRAILLLTAVPVVLGLWASTIYAGFSGLTTLANVLPVAVFQAVIFGLMLGAWSVARRLAQSERPRP